MSSGTLASMTANASSRRSKSGSSMRLASYAFSSAVHAASRCRSGCSEDKACSRRQVSDLSAWNRLELSVLRARSRILLCSWLLASCGCCDNRRPMTWNTWALVESYSRDEPRSARRSMADAMLVASSSVVVEFSHRASRRCSILRRAAGFEAPLHSHQDETCARNASFATA